MSGCGATDQPAHHSTDPRLTLLADASHDASGDPTPCTEWTVQDLVDHIAAAPTRFAHMLRGEPVDWSAPPPPVGEDPAATFRAGYPMVGTLSRR